MNKSILITGANSYIGTSFEKYVEEHYSADLSITTIDMVDGSWSEKSFSDFDVVFHVAGLAHADIGNVSEEVKAKYYAVNTDLAIETAKKAKEDGVKQFVFMSSMIVYGKQSHIDKRTKPHPVNFYGDSKWKADKGVRKEAAEDFTVTVLRPPMIYGKGSKGNYPTLAKLARRVPVFPEYLNRRSMLYIDNLCEFLAQVMIKGLGGVFFPQNVEIVSTSRLVSEIGKATKHKVRLTRLLNPAVEIAKRCPIKKIRDLRRKAFGDSWYEESMSQYDFDYQKVNLKTSIERTER